MTSVKFSFDVSHIRKPIGLLNKKIDDVVSKTLDYAADTLIEEILKTAPVKTGEYATSWKKGEKTDNSIQITTDKGELFIILEYTGSKPHEIWAKPENKKKLLSWKKPDGTRVVVSTKFKPVNHPGFNAIPHVRPALKKISPLIIDELYRNLKKEIPWLK